MEHWREYLRNYAKTIIDVRWVLTLTLRCVIVLINIFFYTAKITNFKEFHKLQTLLSNLPAHAIRTREIVLRTIINFADLNFSINHANYRSLFAIQYLTFALIIDHWEFRKMPKKIYSQQYGFGFIDGWLGRKVLFYVKTVKFINILCQGIEQWKFICVRRAEKGGRINWN